MNLPQFETITEIPLDESGDENRIIKHRHIRLLRISSGIFPRRTRWKAVYRLNPAITNSADYYTSARPSWAVADCIARVLLSGWLPYRSPEAATAP